MTPLRNNKSFLDSICSFKLGLFNAISEVSRILRICLFSGAANKIFQENLGLSFLSSALQVRNLWRYSHVLPIAVLHYVSFHRYMFVYKHIPIQMYIKLKPCNYAIIESNIQLKLQIEIKYVRVLIDPNLIFC